MFKKILFLSLIACSVVACIDEGGKEELTPFIVGDWQVEVTDSVWTKHDGNTVLEANKFELDISLEEDGKGIKYTNSGSTNFTWVEPEQKNPDLILRGPGLLHGGNQEEEYFLEILFGSDSYLEWMYSVDSTFISSNQDTIYKKRKLFWISTPR